MRWFVSLLIHRVFRHLSAGDPSVALRSFAPGAHFRFPGEHPWAVDTDDRAEIEAWFAGFVRLRLNFTIEDLAVAGPPWNMRVFTRGVDHVDVADGQRYENRWVQCLRLRWGRIVDDEIYVDTQEVAHFQRELAARAAARPADV